MRFLDVRVQPSADGEDERLVLVHGVFPIALTGSKEFRAVVLEPVKEFLKRNEEETVIVSVKREGRGKATDEDLGEVLLRHYVADGEGLWWADESIPTLGEARGKIVLLRRFRVNDGTLWGIDGEFWA